jgi:4-amino-4-deoxychorismate lyase
LIFDDEISYSKKYLDRKYLDKLYENKDEFDEIIIIKNKIITDTSIANIAIFYENTWITSRNCLLQGTTRNRLIEEKKILEKDISVSMLKKASKIALMNAMIGFDIKEDYSFSE